MNIVHRALALWFAAAMPVAGEQALQRGDHDLAITCFQHALLLAPDNATFHAQLASAYQAKGNNVRARAALAEALRREPDNPHARFLRGSYRLEQGRFRLALTDFQRSARGAPHLPAIWFRIGNCYQALAEHDKAIAAFSKALRRDPRPEGRAVIYFHRANSHAAKKDLDRALADFNACLRRAPRSAPAHVGRGGVYAIRGDLDRAIAAYDTALRVAPNCGLAYYNRALVWRERAKYDLALADLSAAIHLQDKFGPAYRERAICHAQRGDYADAVTDYSAAIRLGCVDPDTYFARAHAYNELGRYRAAIEDYREVLRLDPNQTEAGRRLVRLLATCPDASVRDLRGAEVEARRLGAGAPGLQSVCATLAAAHARAGALDKAIGWQKRAVELLGNQDREARARAELVLEWYRQRKSPPPP